MNLPISASDAGPGGWMASRPPPAKQLHSSNVDASNESGANCRNTSSMVAATTSPPSTRRMIARWVTHTPFGRSVDPDVYITYARFSASAPPSTASPDCAEIDAASASSRTGYAAPTGIESSNAVVVTTTATSAASQIAATRAGGNVGSTGTYAPPALRIAITATTASTERSRQTPTRTSGRTPRPARCRASRFALASSSAYDSRPSAHATAMASGRRAAQCWSPWWTHASRR